MKLLIKNGRVLDPAAGRDEVCDVLVDEGVIAAVGIGLEEESARVVDAAGCFVMPGLIDLHVHLRDPGLTYKETVASGARAAARGGYTTIVAMPNTKPVMDSADRVAYVHHKAECEAVVNVLQAGAVTVGQQGEELADLAGMVRAGSPAFSEDGKSVMNAALMAEAMREANRLDVPILDHCEDKSLVRGGVMNADKNAERLGLPGITNATEDVIAARDILLAKETGARLHLCHCSTRESVWMVERARELGVRISAEVCPHHFTLTSDDIPGDDANYKMNPPLRTREDVDALRRGLGEGIMDVISTDHAPHSEEEKRQSMRTAPFGIVGLETAASLTYSELVETGIMTPLQMASAMSTRPAQVIGLDKGTLKEGKAADIVVFDPRQEYVIDKRTFASMGKNTPFHGRKVKGKVRMTICAGEIVYQA